MGVSAVGFRGLRPRMIPPLVLGAIVGIVLAYFVAGPPLTPGFKDAARDKCNESITGDFRSYEIKWKFPSLKHWVPHWQCTDLRNPDKEPVSFGWWVDPERG